MHTLTMLGGSLAMTAAAAAAMPDYSGTVCSTDDGVRITLNVETDVTLAIIFPTPPGNNGGWVMTQEAPGLFSHVVTGVAPGDPFSFHLIIQNPQQYQFPEHEFLVTEDCLAFQRDDVTPPPPRGSRHEFVTQAEDILVRFESGANAYNMGETTAVTFRYRLQGSDILSIPLLQVEPWTWEAIIPDASIGQTIEYWFAQQIGLQPQDTGRFSRILGEVLPEPDWPIVTRQTGRFRHRHPNEWRFDNYVEEYGVGKTYELTLVDWGNRVDVDLVVDDSLPVNRVDFRYFTWNDPFTGTCSRPETLINQIMSGGQNHFTHAIEDVTPGTIIDFDLTFIELPTPGLQYYSEFFYYRVGMGTFGPHESNPRMTAAEGATIAHVYSPRFGFAQHVPSLALQDLNAFVEGKVIFETDFETSDLLNFSTHFDCCSGPIGQPIVSSPAFQPDMLGPRYAAASCIQCHVMDGRAPTPQPGQDLVGLIAHTSIPGQGAFGEPIPHPLYGNQVDGSAEGEVTIEGRLQVTYEEITGTFNDGTPYTLRKPSYHFLDMAYGSLGTNLPDTDGTPGYGGLAEFSPRIAPMLPGLGLLEAISAATILSLEDPDDQDGDGISGRANQVWDPQSRSTVLGRFGWKANQPNLQQQTAEAFQRDLGITTEARPTHDCGPLQEDCEPGDMLPELSTQELNDVVAYIQGLALPPRGNYDDPMAIAGLHLFKAANCQACHTPRLQTGSSHPVAAYHDITIEPFTDLLLHDMGPGLADNRPHFEASGSEWRTPPLWALAYVQHALGLPETCEDPTSGGTTPNFLHDGRARSLMEAILWHGGEAESSRQAVLAMSATERAELLAYVAYPFDDPIFHDDDLPECPWDLDGDGVAGVNDILVLLDAWGSPGPGDIDGDGTVDSDDVLVLLAHYGEACP
ncbi:MAG: hypothetical protein MK116_06510 [Phycisphaerales bacterium]|nr:hypothetical protein [Phycisphaerales bacterium]